MEQFLFIAAWALTGAFSGATTLAYYDSFFKLAFGDDLSELLKLDYDPSKSLTLLYVFVCTLLGPIATIGVLLYAMSTRIAIILFKTLCPNIWEEYLESLQY